MSLREWLPRASYDHPVTVLVAFVASLVVGAVAWTRIVRPIEGFLRAGWARLLAWVRA